MKIAMQFTECNVGELSDTLASLIADRVIPIEAIVSTGIDHPLSPSDTLTVMWDE